MSSHTAARARDAGPPVRVGRLLAVLAGCLVGALLVALLSNVAVEFPDTSSPPATTIGEPINNWASVGQTFTVERNGLSRIDVVLGAGGRGRYEPLRFYIKDRPGGTPLRTVLAPHDSLPLGDAGRLRPGRQFETWYRFDFEPIADSAGRQLYFSLEGPGIPQEGTVGTLLFFHNEYKGGQAYVNEQPVWAHVIFRAYSRATPLHALDTTLGNLVFRRPRMIGEPMGYAALAVAYLALGAAFLRRAWRIARG